jgi:type IX secretion system substrate protein
VCILCSLLSPSFRTILEIPPVRSLQPLAISLSPNPATNSLHIQGLPSNQKIKLTVVDFAGNVAISQQLKAIGSSSYNLNLGLLKPSNYLLKIETYDDVITKQFVKE